MLTVILHDLLRVVTDNYEQLTGILRAFLRIAASILRKVMIHRSFLPARRYASAGNSDRNVSVRLSVCPSVLPSVTRRYCVKTKKASGMISSPSGSPKTLVF